MRLRGCSYALFGVCFGLIAFVDRTFAEESVPTDKPAEAQSRQDIENALDTKISFEFVETPLGDVVAFLEEKLKINVKLDTKALEDAGAGTDTPITRHLTDVTVRSQLNLLLSSLDLTYIVDDGVLLITTPEKAGAILRTIVYPVDDLIQGTNEFGEPIQDYEWLNKVISNTVFPTTWDAVGGPASISPFDGRLAISQTEEPQRTIATLLATIREVRDLAADASPPAYVSLERDVSTHDAIRKKLDQSVSLEFVEIPLSDVADHFHELLKINLRLDTKALEDAGAGSDTPITFQCKSLTAGTAIRLMLNGLDLTYIVKDEVLLITTPEKAGNELVLYLYPVRDLLRHAADRDTAFDKLIETITTSVQPTTWDQVGGPGGIMAVPVADAILISQTWESQQEIGQLLKQLRASTATTTERRVEKPATALETRIYTLAKPVAIRKQTDDDKATPATANPVPAGPTAGEVAEALQEFIEPKSWKQGGPSIRVLGDKLIIRQQPGIHRKIDRLLSKIQETGTVPSSGGGFFRLRDGDTR